MDQERIISGAPYEEEQRFELSLRPKHLQEYIGQSQVKQNLEISVTAARSRGEALDHVLLYGPPGLGKTTLGGVIANELGVGLKTTTGPHHSDQGRSDRHSHQSAGQRRAVRR